MTNELIGAEEFIQKRDAHCLNRCDFELIEQDVDETVVKTSDSVQIVNKRVNRYISNCKACGFCDNLDVTESKIEENAAKAS